MATQWVRRELKKDELSKIITETVSWIKSNKQTVLTGIGVFVGVIVIVVYISIRFAESNERAMERLSQVQGQMQARMFNEALAACDDLWSKYPRTPAGMQSLLYKGEILFLTGRYAESSDLYAKFLEKSKQKKLIPLAMSGQAASLESSGDYAKAISVYEEYIKKFPDHFLTPTNYLSLARCYLLAKQPDIAVKTYEKIVTLYPGSNWQKESEINLSVLRK